MKNSIFFILISSLLCLVGACTCAPDISTPQEIDPTTKAQLRVLHFSPRTPALHLLQNDRLLLNAVEYGIPLAQYKELPSGIRNLRFLSPENVSLYSINVDLGINTPYSLVLVDSGQRRSGLLLTNIPPIIPEGKIALRFVHAGIGVRNVTVYKGSTGGSALFSDQPFRSFTPYSIVNADESISLQGETASGTRVFTADASSFQANAAYTLLLGGIDTDSITPLVFAVVKE